MTTLVLGTVGSLVGGMVGGPIGAQVGWLVGSLLGNLIDPPKVEGPRRSDLKLQVSEYGKPIPFVWGTGRITGNVIDQTDLQEHKETSGGKGGPEVTTYTYSASFAIALAASKAFDEPAILGVLRIWADGRLIWDATEGEAMPCTLYLGREDQEPDPTFEAIHGVGEQPAYRGLAYVVFTDYMLTDFGDRIPVLEFEVFTGLGEYPYRISHFDPVDGTPGFRCATYSEGVITVGLYQTAALPNGHYYEWQYRLDGELVAGSEYDAELSLSGFPTVSVQGLLAATDGLTWWVRDASVATITFNPFGGPVLEAGCGSAQAIVYHPAGYIYATGGNTATGQIGICRYPATDGTINDDTGVADASLIVSSTGAGDSLSTWVVGMTNVMDRVYVASGFGDLTLYEYDLELTGVLRQWDLSDEDAALSIINGYSFTVYRSQLTGDLVLGCDRGTGFVKNAGVFTLNDDLTVTYVGQVDAIDGYTSTVAELGTSGYALVADGVIRLDPPAAPVALSLIVADLSDMTSVGSYDVSELTDEVRWFAVGNQMTVRNALETLRKGFFFDAVESDDTVKFRKRGATDSVVTIPDDDLCAREEGAQELAPLQTKRRREHGMPRTVTMRYIDVNMDYQTGAQNSPRLTTLSDSDVTIDLSIGFTADEALQKCWALQVSEWIERETFVWQTTRQYSWVEPCDVVTVRGRVVRVTNRTERPAGVIEWEGVLHRPSIYTQPATGAPSEGWTPQPPPAARPATDLVLLDLPLLDPSHYPNGHYAALAPAAAGPWPGAALYKSVDGGTTYASIAEALTPATLGTVAAALATFAGGNTFDEANTITVILDDADAELVSVTEAAVQNGANLCALGSASAGWEVLQFRTATLTAPQTYVLSGLLRGRYGTEWAMPTHATNETFVMLGTVANVNAPFAELYMSRKYKAVTFGASLTAVTAQDFANNGIALRPYAPVMLGGGRDGSGNLTLNWTPRQRGAGGWPDGIDLPNTELSEQYRVRVYTTSGYATVARTIDVTSVRTAGYTAAEQTTDFGSPQSTIYWDVAKLGSAGYGYAQRGTT